MVDEIELAFREYARDTINLASYTRPMFGKHLTQTIDEFSKSVTGPSGWRDVYKRQEQERQFILFWELQIKHQRFSRGLLNCVLS